MQLRITALAAVLAVSASLPLHAAAPAVAPRCTPETTTTTTNADAAPVPDAGTLVRTITVADAGAHIWDVDVLLAVTHPRSDELDITLTSPSGTVVTLTSNNGSGFANVFNGTLFDDQAAVPVTDATFDNNVVLADAAPEQPLARFYGENPNGIWTLQVTDDRPTDIGTFHSVSLVIATVPELPNEVPRRVVLFPGAAILDNATVTSTQIVRGGGAFVTRVRLRTNITHTWPGDLDITLTSPGGTVVTVTTDNGGSNDNVFNGTWWDDLTGSPVTDFVYTDNVTATPLAPEKALASFIGGPANGAWTLTVTDNASADTGTLVRWDLEVFTGSCARTPDAPPGFAPPVTTTFDNTTSVAVPLTGTVGTTTSTIDVTGAGPYLWDVNAVTHLRHTRSGSLVVTLTSPTGTAVVLTNKNGFAGMSAGGLIGENVFDGTRWDDQADLPATDAVYVNLQPQPALVPEGALGAFIGEDPNGTWTLTIEDLWFDSGTLNGWSLQVATLSGAPAPVTTTATRTSPVGIPDGTQAGLVQTITVPSGGGSFLTRATLRTSILHPQSRDLEIFLTSPAGTTVTISTGNGGFNADVFNGTTWEDRPGSLPATDAPYAANVVRPTLVPEEAMSAFIGENPIGTWTLTVLDGDPDGQSGTLSSWALEIETGAGWNLTQSLTATPAGVGVGGSVSYTAIVGSTGPGAAPGPLTFTMPLPAGMRFTSLVSPAGGWTCTTPAVGGFGTVSCTHPGPLAMGANQTFTIAAAVSPGTPVLTQLTATASVQTASLEATVADNTASATALVVLPTSLDTDGDSLPDEWETRFGLNPASVEGSDGPFGDPDGDGRTNAQELADGTHPRGFFTRYFAEGATGTFFDVRFALLNTSNEIAHTLLRFLPATGGPVGHPVQIAARARATVDPETVAGLAVAEFATVIESDQPIVADRTMRWDTQGYGSHAEASIAGAATQWYLAEGATHSSFQLFYLLQNANATDATVTIEYLLPSGAPILRTYTVAGNSRQTVWVNQEPQLSSTDVSATITSDLPIIVERAMYLDRGGQTFAAGHGSAGVTALNTVWFLAEGATGPYFDLFVLIANPTQSTANITARFLRTDGTVVTRTYSVEPKSRFNIWVDQEGPELADTAVSTIIESDVPVLVERSMWWPGDGTTWHEAHNSFGTTEAGFVWAMAEGEQGGPSSVETYVLVANTSNFAGLVEVRLHMEDGTTRGKTYPVAANSRLNVPVGASESDGGFGPANVDGRRFGVVVYSLGTLGGNPPAKIVVERAMYSNAGGVVWAAGTNALATKLQ